MNNSRQWKCGDNGDTQIKAKEIEMLEKKLFSTRTRLLVCDSVTLSR